MTAIAAVLTAGIFAAAQQGGALEQYRAADRYAKVRIISESVSGKRQTSDDEVYVLLLAGMKDPDTFVRSEAVGMVANILAFSSMPTVPSEIAWIAARAKVGERLWPEMEAAADDPEARVRSEALRGIGGAFAQGYPTIVLPSQIANRLAAAAERDPSPGVRGFAIGAFRLAHRSEDPAVRSIGSQVLLTALDDSDPFIVRSAAHAVAEWKPAEALPLLVKQLKHPSHIARMAVGQIIAAYRDAAAPYLPQLEAAMASETDDITRKTIAGTMSVIRSPSEK